MVLTKNFKFKYVHDNHSLGQSKDKVFVFMMYVDLVGNGVDHVKRMQCGGDMEKYWNMFDRVNPLRDLDSIVCYAYYNKHCKVLTIAYYNMQVEGAQAQTIFWEIRGVTCWRMLFLESNSKDL